VNRIVNAMTVDVEDYFHASAFDRGVSRASWDQLESRVVPNTRRLLDIFSAHDLRATFFVLGWVADKFPSLVKDISAAGHELASHGFHHQLVYLLTPSQFREDVRRSKDTIEQIAGVPVRGYRAPSFSIVKQSLWALDVLIEEGFSYDASIFPIRHDRYGIADAPRHAHMIQRASGSILEMPSSTARVGQTNYPIAGGGYFRLFPYAMTKWVITQVNTADQQPVMLYIHPWEVDPEQPRLPASMAAQLRHHVGMNTTIDKLNRVIDDFAFGPVRDVIKARTTGIVTATPRLAPASLP